MNSRRRRERAFISAGSNDGDRRASLKAAVSEVGRVGGTIVKNVSSIYLSKPVGIGPTRWFLNCVLEVETDLGPLELLGRLEEIEASMGRAAKGLNAPRTIDLDLVLFGEAASDDPRLTIPHPRMAVRRFVLEPLSEIAPNAAHPALGKIAELLPAVAGQEVVRVEPFDPPVSRRRIAVEGPIGAGKTSLAEKLAEYYGARPVHEMSVENPFLGPFYEEPRKFAFAAQLFFLLSRLGMSLEAEKAGVPTVSDFHHDKDLLFSRMNLEGDELRLYNGVRGLLGPRPATPDLTIFLSADDETLFQRTKKRGRACETGITEKYVAEVSSAYRDWCSKYDGGPALMVNANDTDFADDETAFGKLLWRISRPINGREAFDPSDG